MSEYIISIDQSTQGTKAMLFDETGALLSKTARAHAQMIDKRGYVEHDPEEIYANTLKVVDDLLTQTAVDRARVCAVGISNQRETSVAWDRSGKPVYNAIVWQCARGESIIKRLEDQAEMVRRHTGLRLSPYFSAAKLAWIMENVPGVKEEAEMGNVLCGTVDSYLIYRLTEGREFRTDYSNASRTQLFNINTLTWDEEILNLFGIPRRCMAQLTDSDGLFGSTDFAGILPRAVPIHGLMGDSHGALFGHNCRFRGQMKTSYGTGSSIMMNIGEKAIFSELGLVTSLAWKTGGKVQYVLEGNVNYSAAVVTWLKDDMKLIASPDESEELARKANPSDRTYLVPAFSGLGAPYWRSDVSAALIGMSRTTGRAELVRAALEAIAYQNADIIHLMQKETGVDELEVRADGGASKNRWLMQFQSDILACPVLAADNSELAGTGVAYAAGLGAGLYTEKVLERNRHERFEPQMPPACRLEKYEGWKAAVARVL